ncbi:hypothetical protein TeGR_g4177, partial [Tetraparma gracilis]
WDLENISVPAEAEKNREFLCKLPKRYLRLAERSMKSISKLSDKISKVNTGAADAKAPIDERFAWLHRRA